MAGIMIAGTKSGCGKTAVSTALMGALEKVSPFKTGPDYIDPMFHKFITGRNSYNLDIRLHGEEIVKYLYNKHSSEDRISVIEGVMGLYDGYGDELDNCSSAHLARIIGIPVILVVSGEGSSTSVAAEVLGFQEFDRRVNIAGVIVNKVSGEKHYEMIKSGVERYTGVECLGYMVSDKESVIEERHLGLMQSMEIADLNKKLERLKEQALKNINLKRVKEIANQAKCVNSSFEIPKEILEVGKGKKIAVARDEAFSFYYDDNLELLKEMGFELVEFSPIKSKTLPENIDIIYFGGGYPEVYAEKLSANREIMEEIREKSKQGVKIYGECGGFIYLAKKLKITDGKEFDMCGIFDIDIEMKDRLNIKRFGYVELEDKTGFKIRAHEFHYSDIARCSEENAIFKVGKGNGVEWRCCYKKNSTIGGYPHIHFYSNLEIIEKIFISDYK